MINVITGELTYLMNIAHVISILMITLISPDSPDKGTPGI